MSIKFWSTLWNIKQKIRKYRKIISKPIKIIIITNYKNKMLNHNIIK